MNKNSSAISNSFKNSISRLEVEFIREFADYVRIVIEESQKNSKSIKTICRNIFETHTRPFYEKWSQVPIISEYLTSNESFERKYWSFGLIYVQSILLVPHKIVSSIVTESSQMRFQPFLSNISELEDLESFFVQLWKIFHGNNIPVNRTDLQIIEFYTDPDFILRYTRFPSQAEVAQAIGFDPRTILMRTSRLYDLYILSHTYLINMAKLGYQTYSYISEKDPKTVSAILPDYLVGVFPLEFGLKTGSVSVFQIPYWKHDLYKTISDNLEPILEFELSQSYWAWNVAQLTTQSEKRWLFLPPVLTNFSKWEDDIIVDRPGFSISLIPDFNPVPILKSHARLMSHFVKYPTMKDKQIAQMTGMSQDSISRLWVFITENKLLYPFSTLNNVGLDIPLWFVLLNKPDSKNPLPLEKICDHLSHFPFVRILSSNDLVIGKLMIPSNWFKFFSLTWNNLGNEDFIAKYDVMNNHHFLKKNLDIVKTLF